MRKDIAGEGLESTTPTWESLEEFVRERVQDLIQRVLEEEVTELLGREKSERREAVDGSSPE
jgi:transposase-like protein